MNAEKYAQSVDWIDSQRDRMVEQVSAWANINSGTQNLDGLALMSAEVAKELKALGAEISHLDLPPRRMIDGRGNVVEMPLGQAVLGRKRPEAPIRIFLGIHTDTVYAVDHPFQQVQRVDDNTLRGPGVIDAKGGLVVMLTALAALERSPFAEKIGWEVLINPDEEIGSPGSSALLQECARRNHLGLVYEPALGDGSLVSSRKGSGNFDIVIHGKAAHAGRDFAAGRNAIAAAARLAVQLDQLNGSPEMTVNVARIDGGGPNNIVPDLAVLRVNVRVTTSEMQRAAEQAIAECAKSEKSVKGLKVEIHGGFSSPPKIFDEKSQRLFERIAECGRDLGLKLESKPSGGASDGNKLAAAGLPVIDSLGPRGGNMHSSEEFLLLDSLTERAKLSALLLMKFASGEMQLD
ncbi:MAG TPA: hydrolase [Tepidisphaeraceae bacterium]|jgi:glutamate carboxypeptidase